MATNVARAAAIKAKLARKAGYPTTANMAVIKAALAAKPAANAKFLQAVNAAAAATSPAGALSQLRHWPVKDLQAEAWSYASHLCYALALPYGHEHCMPADMLAQRALFLAQLLAELAVHGLAANGFKARPQGDGCVPGACCQR